MSDQAIPDIQWSEVDYKGTTIRLGFVLRESGYIEILRIIGFPYSGSNGVHVNALRLVITSRLGRVRGISTALETERRLREGFESKECVKCNLILPLKRFAEPHTKHCMACAPSASFAITEDSLTQQGCGRCGNQIILMEEAYPDSYMVELHCMICSRRREAPRQSAL